MAFFVFAKVGEGWPLSYVERFCNKKALSVIVYFFITVCIKQIDSMSSFD